MLPFIKPADVRKYYPDIQIDSYDDAVRCIINNVKMDKNERNIIMVHQFVTAGGVDVERCESESLSLGGIDNIDVSIFDDFDYVAMGHIHKGQKLIKDTVRYSGSPLKYSFSEVNHRKSVPIIEFIDKLNNNGEFQYITQGEINVTEGFFVNYVSSSEQTVTFAKNQRLTTAKAEKKKQYIKLFCNLS